MRILAVNVGSSSLRMDLWELPGTSPQVSLRAEGVGAPHGTIAADDHQVATAAFAGHGAALDALVGRLPQPIRLDGIGHRLVHGGPSYREPVWIDDRVLAGLAGLVRLDPLHVPPAVEVIRQLVNALPRVPQAAVFDTAFHATLPPHAFEYAVPAAWRAQGVRRYGFHGLACADAVFQLGPQLRERAVLLHLGAGCSATAILRGRSIDTTMGLTPLEGLVMATRCGDLDPAIVLYLQRQQGLSVDQLDHALNYESGLLGLSGVSGDMKTLLEQTHASAVQMAIEVFCYRAAKAAGALAVALGGCDQLLFTGGIGEHAAPVRAKIAGRLEFLGARIDEKANVANATVVSLQHSGVAIHVVRIDEGRQIAFGTAKLVGHGLPPR
jgi:acetate kinase